MPDSDIISANSDYRYKHIHKSADGSECILNMILGIHTIFNFYCPYASTSAKKSSNQNVPANKFCFFHTGLKWS